MSALTDRLRADLAELFRDLGSDDEAFDAERVCPQESVEAGLLEEIIHLRLETEVARQGMRHAGSLDQILDLLALDRILLRAEGPPAISEPVDVVLRRLARAL